jgi:MFS family permease
MSKNRTDLIRKGLKYSIFDGSYASIYANLTGTVFLPGFALVMGASPFQIGLIAALPFLGNIFQIFGSYFVVKFGNRKRFTIMNAIASYLFWVVIVILGLLSPLFDFQIKFKWIILLLTFSFIAASSAGIPWMSWMSDLVPEKLWGRYFGKRNMYVGLIGLTSAIIAGQVLDLFDKSLSGFYVIFTLAITARAISVFFITRVPDPYQSEEPIKIDFFRVVKKTWSDLNFRKYIIFAVIWGASVNLPGPFYAVFMINNLKLDYSFMALLVASTALMDLVGQRFWGPISDKIGNKPVMIITGFLTIVIPFFWLFAGLNWQSIYVILPILHLYAGFFWSGFNLCAVNLLFRLAPREYKTVFFAVHAAATGLVVALATFFGGVIANFVEDISLFQLEFLTGLKILFAISFLTRFVAMPFLIRINENSSIPVTKVVKIIRHFRSLNTMQGFHPVLHYVTSIKKSAKNLKNSIRKNTSKE